MPDSVAAIRELYRRRDDFLREESALTVRMKRIVARVTGAKEVSDAALIEFMADYPPMIPFLSARKTVHAARMVEEKALRRVVEQLPIWASFGKPIHNFGPVSLGQIVGEAGDLSVYGNPAKLWKRMGLGLVNGERQRKCVDVEKAALHGYSSRRRSVMFVIGDNLVKGKSEYRALYDARKAFERQKAEAEGLKVAPSAKIPKGKQAEYRSDGHVHLRAKRYIEKRLLRNLWRAWRGLCGDVTHVCCAPAPAESAQ